MPIVHGDDDSIDPSQAGHMEHAVITREMISHSTSYRKDLCMVQIDFSNAFGSVYHDLILSNMTSMAIPTACVELVRNICTDHSSKILLTGGDTPFIQWQDGASTVHIHHMCDKRGVNSIVTKRHHRVGCAVGDAARARHNNKCEKINENQSIHRVCQQIEATLTERLK
jgi:hypothetical protein